MKKTLSKAKRAYLFWSNIWAREIAAGLTFYFITGLAPALCLLAFVLKSNLPTEISKQITVFRSVGELAEDLSQSASSAAKGGGIVLAITSAYSSLNLFYRFKKCGEILYECNGQQNTFVKRLRSFIAMAVVLSLFAFASFVYFAVRSFIDGVLLSVAASVVMAAVAFGSLVILNRIICPYKLSFSELFPGCVLSLVLWVIITASYALYLDYFADFQKLYGALGSMFALMLYSYLMMQAFTFGVAYIILKLGKSKRKKRCEDQ